MEGEHYEVAFGIEGKREYKEFRTLAPATKFYNKIKDKEVKVFLDHYDQDGDLI